MLERVLRRLGAWPRVALLALVSSGVAVVAGVDLATGYEISLSLFYLVPIGIAAWTLGRAAGLHLALLSCACWYAADVGAGAVYSNPAIPLWNAGVRLGFFASTSVLLDALHRRLVAEELRSSTDALTGLLNARGFRDRVRQALALAHRQGTPVALAYVDIDDFKRVNDEHGHGEGDAVLSAVAEAIARELRAADCAGRLGGDEFALLLADTGAEGAGRVVSRVRARIDRTLRPRRSIVTCSMGVVTFARPPATAEEALDLADRVMYGVKGRGKNAVCFRAVDPGTGELAEPAEGPGAPPRGDAGS